ATDAAAGAEVDRASRIAEVANAGEAARQQSRHRAGVGAGQGVALPARRLDRAGAAVGDLLERTPAHRATVAGVGAGQAVGLAGAEDRVVAAAARHRRNARPGAADARRRRAAGRQVEAHRAAVAAVIQRFRRDIATDAAAGAEVDRASRIAEVANAGEAAWQQGRHRAGVGAGQGVALPARRLDRAGAAVGDLLERTPAHRATVAGVGAGQIVGLAGAEDRVVAAAARHRRNARPGAADARR